MSNLNPAVQMSRRKGIVGAVQRDDPEELQRTLDSCKVLGLDDLSKALHVAAKFGYEECARILLKNDALPNIHDASGFSPVVVAASQGHVGIIRVLLAAKCNVNKATFRIRATALHWAATNSHIDCVRALLDAGANPDAQTINGRTPLMMASRTGCGDSVAELLEYDVDVHMRDHVGCTALHLAAEEGNTSCAWKLLCAGADVNAQNRNGDTPIMLAARSGKLGTLKLLLRQESCDLTKQGHKMTALHWAAEGGHEECVGILLDAGMDPDVITPDSYYGGDFIVNGGVTPLMLACRRGHTDIVKLLISKSRNVNVSDDESTTALLYATKHDNDACVKELIIAGANPNGQIVKSGDERAEEIGISPLFLAIKYNSKKVVKILLQANCELDILGFDKGDNPVTPLEFALTKCRIDLVRMLMAVSTELYVGSAVVLEDSLLWLANEDEQVFDELTLEIRTAPSLLKLSRACIRKVMGRRTLNCVNELPLPPTIRNFVDLDELEDYC